MFFIISVVGCYEDKGNYDYKDLSEVEISGIDEEYTVNIGSEFSISPKLTYKDEGIKNIKYTWKINDKVISEEKELNIVVDGLEVKPNQYSEFDVTDVDNGIVYSKLFRISVESTFKNGWLLLSDGGNSSTLDFIRQDGKIYNNVYERANKEKLSGGAQSICEHFLPWSEETGQIFVACDKAPAYSVELDGNSFIKMISTKDEFEGGIPDDFKPMGMKCVSSYDYLFSNGKLYVRNDNSGLDSHYQSGSFPNFPVPGEYKFSNILFKGNFVMSSDIYGFDENSKSYLMIRNGLISKFDYVNDKYQKFIPYDMNMDLLAAGAYSTTSPSDKFISILKNNINDEVHVHSFGFVGWGSKKYYSIKDTIFPDNSIIKTTSKYAICLNRPYVYIASDGVLYQYNRLANTITNIRDFGREIRDIEICSTDQEKLGVVLVNALDNNRSDFYLLDVSIVGGGKTVEGYKHIGEFGKVVDLSYKVGSQWDMY
ncbi:MAG: PKD-like family lipoprotein [Bacilli bacterium]